MAAGKRSKSQEAYASRYKTTIFAANRKKKLERIVKEQPNNEKAVMALKDIHYRRGTPKTYVWSASAKREAMLIAEFSKATNIAANSEKATRTTDSEVSAAYKSMFAIKARLHNGSN